MGSHTPTSDTLPRGSPPPHFLQQLTNLLWHVDEIVMFFLLLLHSSQFLPQTSSPTLEMFVCFDHSLFTPASTPKEWIFACTAIFTPASRAVVLCLRGDLTCMLRICLYRRESMEGERRRVGNVSFRWWRKPECPERTTSQPQVTDNLLTYG